MEARELRIGNYILCRGSLARVTSIAEDGIGYVKHIGIGEEKIPLKLVKPIPLTEEWLVKLGFEPYNYTERERGFIIENKKAHKSIYIRAFVDSNDSQINSVFNRSECDREQIQFITQVNHVHQLQNLFYSLSGEELTIKND